jgi:hypothetical protein
LESGRLAGETICDVHLGRGTHRRYYRSLRRSVLVDSRLSYSVSRLFYGNLNRWLKLLENPLIWRPLVQGYADGKPLCKCCLMAATSFFRSYRSATRSSC